MEIRLAKPASRAGAGMAWLGLAWQLGCINCIKTNKNALFVAINLKYVICVYVDISIFA